MYLTIHRPSGLIACSCNDIVCVPSQRKINELAKAGYRFEVDGVAVSNSQVRKACKESSEVNHVVPDDVKSYIENDVVDTQGLVERESDSYERQLISNVIGV